MSKAERRNPFLLRDFDCFLLYNSLGVIIAFGMKLKTLLRPSLTIVFAFIGAVVARSGTPPAIFAITGEYFLIVAVLAFGILGFMLPEIAELAGKAGVAALARQIAKYLPDPRAMAAYPAGLVGGGKRSNKYINPMVVDTSVLIDGRILDIASTNFMFGTFIVIPAVIAELHMLADSADDLKRARGRRGLDVLAALRKQKDIRLELTKNDPKADSTDAKLVRTAGNLRGKLVTVDFNLNKVATAKGITVLNLNDLASAVKTAVLPHERLTIRISTIGKEKNQGVGYLEDGTMVVVEEGAKLKGKMVEVEVLRLIQTAAGKMVFGKTVIATSH